MLLREVQSLLHAKVLTHDSNPEMELTGAFSSDKLSHVLAFTNDKSILITGLYNLQVIRTAELMGIECVIFIGKDEPDDIMIEMAEDLDIVVLHSPYSMFVTSGILYSNGLGKDE